MLRSVGLRQSNKDYLLTYKYRQNNELQRFHNHLVASFVYKKTQLHEYLLCTKITVL